MDTITNEVDYKRVDKKLKFSLLALSIVYIFGIVGSIIAGVLLWMFNEGEDALSFSDFVETYWWVYLIIALILISTPFVSFNVSYLIHYDLVFLTKKQIRRDRSFLVVMRCANSDIIYWFAKRLVKKYNFAQEAKKNAHLFSESQLIEIEKWEEKIKKYDSKNKEDNKK